jgi:signal peptidase I
MPNDNNQSTSPNNKQPTTPFAPTRAATPATAPQRQPSLYRRAMNFMSHTPGGAKPDGGREVVETIVFVVVLVLLLKSFVAEAFVIPTGSMAETLYGYQKIAECPECGEKFPVNCSSEVEEKPPKPVIGCTCPYCRYPFHFVTEHPSCNSGDRVLVSKFAYTRGPLGHPVRPLDVVVFKFPEEPQRDFVPMNYIKRCIGVAGQTVGIYYGDVYIAENLPYEPDPEEQVAGVDLRRHMRPNKMRELLEQRSSEFKIMRKPPLVMMAMRRPVYDNNHRAKTLAEIGFPERWAAEKEGGGAFADPPIAAFEHNRANALNDKAWIEESRGFRHAARQGDGVDWLRYRHVLFNWSDYREALFKELPQAVLAKYPNPESHFPLLLENFIEVLNASPEDKRSLDAARTRLLTNSGKELRTARPQLITDFMGYNAGIPSRGVPEQTNPVSDLMLDCKVQVEQADGDLILELSKGPERFQAQWQLATGICKLVRVSPQGGPGETLMEKPTILKKPGEYRLRFANFDERLTVWVDSTLPFDDGVTYDPPRDEQQRVVHGPIEKNDLEPASIGVRGAGVRVFDLQLWRDTYYTYTPDFSDNTPGAPSVRANTYYVQPGHYFCLGDNSAQSSDSRTWDKRNGGNSQGGGLVPERLLLGRALMVYWPYRRVGPIR